MGEYFLCIVRYTFYQYKLVKLAIDGTETEIYDFKNYYAGFEGGNVADLIDLSGCYAFFYASLQGSQDLIVVDWKDNVLVIENISNNIMGRWQVGQYSFSYDANNDELKISKIGIPIR